MPTLEPEEIVVSEDTLISGMHNGSVTVDAATLVIRGTVSGSLAVNNGARVVIETRGMVNGSTAVSGGSVVEVRGGLHGSTHIEAGSQLTVAAGGTVAGSMHNEGRVIVQGRIAGTHRGHAAEMLPGSRRVEPTIAPDGTHRFDL